VNNNYVTEIRVTGKQNFEKFCPSTAMFAICPVWNIRAPNSSQLLEQIYRVLTGNSNSVIQIIIEVEEEQKYCSKTSSTA
jgi:hypothetical protein